jgi:HAD superfamily hydrolase (TIGR01509 family)
MAIRGVIFDVDGTLVDSNDAHARAWADALAEAGHRVPVERIRPLIGMGGDKLMREAAGIDADGAEGQSIVRRRGAIFRQEHVPRLRPFEGARDLCLALRARARKLAVASSAEDKDLDPLLRIAGVQDLLEGRASGDDAEASKPDPDIVLAALRDLACPSSDAILVGDTPYDVEAARRAGVACIGFRCGGWDDRGLAGAIAVYDGPLDLLANLASSPLVRGTD